MVYVVLSRPKKKKVPSVNIWWCKGAYYVCVCIRVHTDGEKIGRWLRDKTRRIHCQFEQDVKNSGKSKHHSQLRVVRFSAIFCAKCFWSSSTRRLDPGVMQRTLSTSNWSATRSWDRVGLRYGVHCQQYLVLQQDGWRLLFLAIWKELYKKIDSYYGLLVPPEVYSGLDVCK